MAGENERDPLEELEEDAEGLPALEPSEDVASAKKVRKRALSLKQKAAEEERFLRGILSDEIGRRVLWGILQAGHPFDTKFAAGPAGFPDQNATWMHHGEQQLGLGLYHKWLIIDPQSVFLMLAENDSRFQTAKKRK